MKLVIKKVENKDREYIAYIKPYKLVKARFFVYFEDNISGSISLCDFVQMIKMYFDIDKINIENSSKNLFLKNPNILKILK